MSQFESLWVSLCILFTLSSAPHAWWTASKKLAFLRKNPETIQCLG